MNTTARLLRLLPASQRAAIAFSRAKGACRRTHTVPFVIDSSPRGGERAYDIYSRLLRERILCLFSPVDSGVAGSLVAQMLYLAHEDPTRPLHLYVNSPGGSVTAGLAILDTMNYIEPPVHTVCVGQAASMTSLLLCAGAKGHRYALPNARVMMHQPSGGAQGTAADILIHAREIELCRSKLAAIYATYTNRQLTEIERCLDRDTFFSADEAREFGIIDSVVKHAPSSATAANKNNASDNGGSNATAGGGTPPNAASSGAASA